MAPFLMVGLWIIVPCTFIATVRLSLEGIPRFPKHPVVRFCSSPYWCFSLIILIGLVGEFGRGVSSPFPWIAFADAYSQHGIPTGILALLGTLSIDLWLFWTPSQIYKTRIAVSEPVSFWSYIDRESGDRNNLREVVDFLESIHLETVKQLNKKKIIFVRIINLLVGLLLVTPNNSLYSLGEYLAKHAAS